MNAPLIFYTNQANRYKALSSEVGAVLITSDAEELKNEVEKLLLKPTYK
jgi:hypothetical protein